MRWKEWNWAMGRTNHSRSKQRNTKDHRLYQIIRLSPLVRSLKAPFRCGGRCPRRSDKIRAWQHSVRSMSVCTVSFSLLLYFIFKLPPFRRSERNVWRHVLRVNALLPLKWRENFHIFYNLLEHFPVIRNEWKSFKTRNDAIMMCKYWNIFFEFYVYALIMRASQLRSSA